MNIVFKGWRWFITKLGDIYFATEPPKVHAKDIRKLNTLLLPGDVVCRRYIYYLDTYLIPGKYSHSGIVVDGETMVHAVAEGVDYIDVMDFVKDSDGFILLRPPANAQATIDFARRQVGKPYDFLFDKTTKDAIYCHELSYFSLLAGGMIIKAGKRIYADDLIRVCDIILEV